VPLFAPSAGLETERLLLRPLVPSDAPVLHRLIDQDSDVRRWDAGETRTQAERHEAVAHRIFQYGVFGFGCFAVVLRESSELIGQAGLSPWAFEEDGVVTVEFEVMYTLGKDWWGRGIATEAARAWVAHAFGVCALRRLLVGPLKDNRRSIRVLEKLGFSIGDDPLDPASVLAVLENHREGRPAG